MTVKGNDLTILVHIGQYMKAGHIIGLSRAYHKNAKHYMHYQRNSILSMLYKGGSSDIDTPYIKVHIDT